jgi:growth hormone secretagogue receptor/G protein-coupled receptor 139
MENLTDNATTTQFRADENTSSSAQPMTSTETLNITNDNTCLHAFETLYFATIFRKYFVQCIFAVGIPGNLLAFLVWIRPRMQNSSGVYLAALSLVHLVFLHLYLILIVEIYWGIRLLSFPVICEVFPIFSYFFQYMDPLLVSAFSVERYISICHPLKRLYFCTQKKAIIVTIILGLLSAFLSAIHGYFWSYEDGGCFIRDEVLVGDEHSLFVIWAYITEIFSFFVLPLFIMIVNIRLLYYISYERHNDIGASEIHNTAKMSSVHTIVLLYVSLVFILSTFPVSVMYVLNFYFRTKQGCTYILFSVGKIMIETVGQIHFAVNIFIYITTGTVFRSETKSLFKLCIR